MPMGLLGPQPLAMGVGSQYVLLGSYALVEGVLRGKRRRSDLARPWRPARPVTTRRLRRIESSPPWSRILSTA